VVAEVALAMVLFLGAGLLLNSYRRLQGVDPGFDPENLVSLSVTLPESRYPDRAARITFWDDVTTRVDQLPQVETVSWARVVPPLRLGTLGTVNVEGRPEMTGPGGNPVHAGNWVSRDYFETLGLRFLEGRTFSQHEMANPNTPIIINRTLARFYWPDGGAVGSRIQLKSPLNPDWPSPWLDVVGVVDNVQAWGLGDAPDRFQLYMPITQMVRSDGVLLVRTNTEARATIPVIQEQVWSVDQRLPIQDASMVRERLLGSVERDRFNALLLTAFAALGLFLAAVGVFGVVSLSVGQRTREIGIRTALGAGRTRIIRAVVGRTASSVLVGLLLGWVLARVFSRVLEELLFGIEATDPSTHALVIVLMAGVSLAACIIPSWKAMAVDPREALRGE
jgi:putative ABC transport system permease protein